MVAAICAASVLGQQPDEFNKKGGKGGRGSKMSKFMTSPSPEVLPIHRWEYAVRREHEISQTAGGDLQRGLNQLGDSGWELVSAATNTFYFKRPKNNPPPPPLNEPRREGSPAPPIPPGEFGEFARTLTRPVPSTNEKTTFVQLKNAEASSVAQILSSVYRDRGVRFVPETRTNRLILLVPEEKLADIRKFIDELDQPFKSLAPRAK
ncbi:hypothetical protein BH10PLA2_BH10PLA2_07380 [soil metagenome]